MTPHIAVLGAGPGGYVAAVRAAQRGARVTLVEADNVGGTCLNWGCIPSKVLIRSAEQLRFLAHAEQFGILLEGSVRIDWARLMQRKQQVVGDQSRAILQLLRRHKVDVLFGRGVVEAPGRLRVDRVDGGVQELDWDKLIVATGTRPSALPGLSFEDPRILSSNDALTMDSLPESVLIVGAGVIGCEFAFMLEALGCRVHLVEALERVLPLPSVDAACSKVLAREMKKRKIACYLKQTVRRVEETRERLQVELAPFGEHAAREAPGKRLEVERILVSVGRVPNTAGVGLEGLGVALDSRGYIVVNDRMETSARGVYAIGDVLGPEKIMLAHVASAEGLVAAENALGGERRMDYRAVPGAIFTSPEVACVGLTEAQARAQGVDVLVSSALFRHLGKAQVLGELAGEAKIVAERETGRLLGVHLIGAHATDLIAEGALAVQAGMTLEQLARTVHAHPTLAEIMAEAALKALGRAVHA